MTTRLSLPPRTSRALLPTLLFLAMVVVALNTFFAFRAQSVLIASEFWVNHTWRVLYKFEDVMGSAKDAETGARGFLITGDTTYLAPYNEGLHNLPGELEELHALTADNPEQAPRLAKIQAVLDSRLASLGRMVELRRTMSLDQVRAQTPHGVGHLEMEHLRSIVNQAQQNEWRLLQQRTAENRKASLRARLTTGVASLLDLLMIALVFRFLFRERGLRLVSEETSVRLALAQAEAEQRAGEILKLNATLEERVNLRTAELATTNRELEAFSYSVSHDLRAPLRTIDGFSLALEEDYAAAVDETGRDYIRRVRTGVQRMGQLIDALLQLSRITRAELTREVVDLSRLAGAVAADLAHTSEGSRATFHIEPGMQASADPGLLQVALENLLGNAVKFSSKRPDPVVEVGWDTARDAWFIRDNGAGFDMYYAEKLFNAFNRLHGDKDFKGSGIGLATVARVIQRHHGRIWADSVIDHGATFWFTLG